MIRRSPLRLTAVAATIVTLLSGCATFSDADVLAQVGDDDISNDDFEVLADEFFAAADVFGTTPSIGGRVDAEQSRSLLGAMVRQRIVDQFLDQQGIDATEIRETHKSTVLAPSPVGALSEGMQDLIATIDPSPRAESVAMAVAPDIGGLQALYADNPAKTGVLCTRHILVETEADAERIVDELTAGADFATLASERSIDPTAADIGGALTSGDNQCIPLQTVLGSFDPDFVAGALAAREGVPSVPVESSFGWHVILHRPWDEIAESVGQLHQPGDSGVFLFDGFAVTADVAIDARFGTWDPITSIVAPIG